uniref:Transcription termination/antitermination protein NusA n=1 Tax=Macrostomum lignano TaxID=282301 RepID=A0A1I8GR50_9PLAT
MDEEVKRNVLEVIQLACDTHGNSREAVARSIKQQLDRQLAPNWQQRFVREKYSWLL